jgi:hypothetical protein
METAIKILILAVLLVTIYQDLKMRLIHVALPILLLGFGLLMNWNSLNYIEWGKSFLFLVLNFIVVTVYFSIKNKAYLNPFDKLIGWGDVLFFIALIPFFDFRAYLIFFVLSLLFSLLLFLVMKSIYSKYKTVPLAGFMALFFIGIIVIDQLTNQTFLLQ